MDTNRCQATHNPGVWPYAARCVEKIHPAGTEHIDRHGNTWLELPASAPVEVHRLDTRVGWVGEPLAGYVYPHLLQLAQPVLQVNRHRLFHDALWLARNLATAQTFFYAVHDEATFIGDATQAAAVYETREPMETVRVYRLRVFQADGGWRLEILDVTGAPAGSGG